MNAPFMLQLADGFITLRVNLPTVNRVRRLIDAAARALPLLLLTASTLAWWVSYQDPLMVRLAWHSVGHELRLYRGEVRYMRSEPWGQNPVPWPDGASWCRGASATLGDFDFGVDDAARASNPSVGGVLIPLDETSSRAAMSFDWLTVLPVWPAVASSAALVLGRRLGYAVVRRNRTV
jgi:hypothetical protein